MRNKKIYYVDKAAEDKQLICNALCKTLQLTREFKDIIKIVVAENEETATIYFIGGKKIAFIAWDSGSAMIRDILEVIR